MKLENVADIYPLSPVQQGMLFHTLTAPNSGVYIEQYTCKIKGELQEKFFKLAWEKVIERHETLRTAFVWEGLDEPLQIVRQKVEILWTFEDWCKLDSTKQKEQLDDLLEQDRFLGFQLEKAPLMRLKIIYLQDKNYQLIWTFHHLISDGWSTLIILKEVFALYASLCQKKEISLPSSPPYKDYIAWLQQQDLNKAKIFWQQVFKGFTEPTPLPISNSFKSTSNYQQKQISLNPKLSESLNTWAKQNRLTLNTVINGAWSLLLSRYSGEQEIVYGTTVSGRPTTFSGVEEMVGIFINSLPVRVNISPQQQLIPWLQEIQLQLLKIRDFEYTPLVNIQQWSEVPQGKSLFDSLVVFENYPEPPQTEDIDLTIDEINYREQSNYPLALLVVPKVSLKLILIYDGNRFDSGIITRMLASLETLLQGFFEHPNSNLIDLPILTEAEKNQLLLEWNKPQTKIGKDVYIYDLFKEQVKQNPHAVAVTFENQSLTYQELNQKANCLAHYLQSLGVGSDVCVGIFLERSLEMVIAILGILIAGGAYVPLDPDYPQERLIYILQDTETAIILTQQKLLNLLPKTPSLTTGFNIPTFCLDTDWQKIEDNEDLKSSLINLKSNDSLAYIIYTSGSTGKPKGVLVTHSNLVHSTTARIQYYNQSVGNFLLLSSFAFDSSVAGIFWTVCQGGTLVLPKQKLEQDIQALATLISREQITHTLCLPSLYNLLLTYTKNTELESLKVVIVAGEGSWQSLATLHHEKLPDTSLYNEYGPTEATVWSSVYQVPKTMESSTIPIGKPIANTQIYLLNNLQQLVPIGVPGEIFIGGSGVVQGYLNQPEKTNQQFIPNPFSQVEGDYLYRTGDLARYLPDGNIEFLGRVDRQVKIRGYRIELGEIEDILKEHETVQEAVLVTQSIQPSSDSDSVESLVTQLLTLHEDQVKQLLINIEEND
ncbi:amino acid adenylation domain-containing protein [Crocosphaera sp.]|uniref:non-ribosomal peptide synthetase n=1 Tax=Crocosphaera sp. TaxID=2729996 RepID=UPI002604AEA9|nr:amino acid adenylation domain-containing protein [Crocosphaera sp.]MDJ0579750.1 amino acid adenylation domain-containing protein [Crocosphaera sp.]